MADVTIDAVISNAAVAGRGMRSVVFTTASIGYCFYVDSDGTFGYCKTTDGGETWGAQVEIAAATTHTSWDVWFDQWTPGDSGTLIHTWYVDTTNDDVTWRTLDTNGDSLGTAVAVISLTSATQARGSFVSGTKTRSGYLYVAYDIDAGAERGLHRSTDSGTSWSANLSTTFVEATIDQCFAFPASNTGDDNDSWFLYQDASTDELTLKMWDSSAGSATESSSIMTLVENTTDGTGQYGFSASVRHSDGHLIVAAISEYDAAGVSDHRIFDINGTGSITEKTAIQSDTDDHYYPAVFIDQNTDDIYVAYNGLRDGSEVIGTTTKIYYTKSTDDGATWTSGNTAYSEAAAGVNVQVWAPLMGPRFYVAWRAPNALKGNFVNSLTFAAGAISGSAALAFAAGSSTLTGAGVLSGSAAIVTGEGSSTLAGSGVLAGSSALTFTPEATGQLIGALAGSADIVTASTGTMLGAGALLGSGDLLFGSGSSAMEGAGVLAGTAAISFGAGSSTLTGSGTLTGTAAVTFADGSSALTGAGSLVGSSAAVFTPEATLTGAAPEALVGTSVITITSVGTLTGAGSLAGTAAITITPTGTLAGSGSLEGTSGLTLAGTAAPAGFGSLAGVVDMVLGASGTAIDLVVSVNPSAIRVDLIGTAARFTLKGSPARAGTLEGTEARSV